MILDREAPDLDIAGFYLVAPIGFSSYGPVVLGRRTGGARPNETPDISIEVMPPSIAADPRRSTAFRHRSAQLPIAEHPALGRAVEASASGASLIIAREHAGGLTLAERISKKPLPEGDAVDLGRALGEALGVLAFNQTWHGAVRPENIVLNAEGRWILRYVGETPAPAEWDPEQPPPVVDLPRWLSPEQIQGKPLDHRSDVFSLGCSLFELVSYVPAFNGSTKEIVTQIAGGPIPSLRRLTPELDHGLDEIIRRATWNAALAIRQDGLGHLSVGANADVAVWRIETGQFGYVDGPGSRLNGTQRIFCELTLRNGKVVYDLNGLTKAAY